MPPHQSSARPGAAQHQRLGWHALSEGEGRETLAGTSSLCKRLTPHLPCPASPARSTCRHIKSLQASHALRKASGRATPLKGIGLRSPEQSLSSSRNFLHFFTQPSGLSTDPVAIPAPREVGRCDTVRVRDG